MRFGRDVVKGGRKLLGKMNRWRWQCTFLVIMVLCLVSQKQMVVQAGEVELKRGESTDFSLPHEHCYSGSYDAESESAEISGLCFEREVSVWMPCKKRANCQVHYTDGRYESEPDHPHYREYSYEVTWDCSTYPYTEYLSFYQPARDEPHREKQTRYGRSCNDTQTGSASITSASGGNYVLRGSTSITKNGCSVLWTAWDPPIGGRIVGNNCTVTANGVYTFWVCYSDLGIMRFASGSVIIRDADVTPPVIDGADYVVTKPNREARVNVQAHDPSSADTYASGIAGYMVSKNSGRPAAQVGGWEASEENHFEFVLDREYEYSVTRIYIWVMDKMGNVSKNPVILFIDLQPPTIGDLTPDSYKQKSDVRTYEGEKKSISLSNLEFGNERIEYCARDYGYLNRELPLSFYGEDQEQGAGLESLTLYQSADGFRDRRQVKKVRNTGGKGNRVELKNEWTQEGYFYFILEAKDQKGNYAQFRISFGLDYYSPIETATADYRDSTGTKNGTLDLEQLLAVNRKELQSVRINFTVDDRRANGTGSGLEWCRVTMLNKDTGEKKIYSPDGGFTKGNKSASFQIPFDFSNSFFFGDLGIVIEGCDLAGNDLLESYNIGIVSFEAIVKGLYPGDIVSFHSGSFIKLQIKESGYLDEVEIVLPEVFARESYAGELTINGERQKAVSKISLKTASGTVPLSQNKEMKILIPVSTAEGNYSVRVRGKKNNRIYVYNPASQEFRRLQDLEITLQVKVKGSILDDLQTTIVNQ